MGTWRELENGLDSESFFDPLCVERSAPIDDDEAALIEALCQTATPGPLVVDDDAAAGEGSVVATLSNGRTIVSLTAGIEHTKNEGTAGANAELICKARYLLLRLLRDRQQWKEEREFLVQRIRTLEVLLQGETGRGSVAANPAPLPR